MLKVKVLEISKDGKIRLSHKAVLEDERNQAINKTTLDNGVRIVSLSMPHVRSVSMGVWVHVGARDEIDAESGLSHFIEHMIFKGTTRRSAFQIAKEFDAIGGQTNAFTSMEHTCYHARVLDTHCPPWWISFPIFSSIPCSKPGRSSGNGR
jgi:predicted Zn-dependent peptidase